MSAVGRLDEDQARAIVRAFWLEEVRTLRDRHDRERLGRNLPPIQNREIAEATGIPRATLSDLLTCKRNVVPDWDRFGLIVECLGGTSREWVPKWRAARAAYDSFAKSTPSGSRPRSESVPELPRKRRRKWLLLAAAAVAVVIGVGIWIIIRPGSDSPPSPGPKPGVSNGRCLRVTDETKDVEVFKSPAGYDEWTSWPGKTRFWSVGGTATRYQVPLDNGQYGYVNRGPKYVVPADDCH